MCNKYSTRSCISDPCSKWRVCSWAQLCTSFRLLQFWIINSIGRSVKQGSKHWMWNPRTPRSDKFWVNPILQSFWLNHDFEANFEVQTGLENWNSKIQLIVYTLWEWCMYQVTSLANPNLSFIAKWAWWINQCKYGIWWLLIMHYESLTHRQALHTQTQAACLSPNCRLCSAGPSDGLEHSKWEYNVSHPGSDWFLPKTSLWALNISDVLNDNGTSSRD